MGKELKIVSVKVKDLKPYENNPRINDGSVEAVKNSIEMFGWRVPIVITPDKVIVCGHTRYKAARLLQLETVPCVVADDLTDEQIRAFRLVDNKTQELSSWDFSLLIDELRAITGLDMSKVGFEAIGMVSEEPAERESGEVTTDEGGELDVGDFADETFTCQCPDCGFRFNE